MSDTHEFYLEPNNEDDLALHDLISALISSGLLNQPDEYDTTHFAMTDTQIKRAMNLLSDKAVLNPRGAGRKPVYLRITDPNLATMVAWDYLLGCQGIPSIIPTVTVKPNGDEKPTSTRTYQKRIASLRSRFDRNHPEQSMHDPILRLPLEKALNAVR